MSERLAYRYIWTTDGLLKKGWFYASGKGIHLSRGYEYETLKTDLPLMVAGGFLLPLNWRVIPV